MQYYADYSAHSRKSVQALVGARVLDIHEPWSNTAGIILDLFEIEAGVPATTVAKIAQHLYNNPNSTVILNLSHEQCSAYASGCEPYITLAQRFPQSQVTVYSSCQDTLDVIQHHIPSATTLLKYYWENNTRMHLEHSTLDQPPETTARISSLNRRYTPTRALAIKGLWECRGHLAYTLGSGDSWGTKTDQQWQHAVWRDSNYTDAVRDKVLKWQRKKSPFQQLEDATWEFEATFNFTNAADIALVVESKTEFDNPRRSSFLTEKTFRPIALGKPIILIAQPTAIQDLNQLGYSVLNREPSLEDAIKTAKRILCMTPNHYKGWIREASIKGRNNQQLWKSRTA